MAEKSCCSKFHRVGPSDKNMRLQPVTIGLSEVDLAATDANNDLDTFIRRE